MSSRATRRVPAAAEVQGRATQLAKLKIDALQKILEQQRVSFRSGVKKAELVRLIMTKVDGHPREVVESALRSVPIGRSHPGSAESSNKRRRTIDEDDPNGEDREDDEDNANGEDDEDGDKNDEDDEDGDKNDENDEGEEEREGDGNDQEDDPNESGHDEEARKESEGTSLRPKRKKTAPRRFDDQVAVDAQLDEAARQRGDTMASVVRFADPPGGPHRPNPTRDRNPPQARREHQPRPFDHQASNPVFRGLDRGVAYVEDPESPGPPSVTPYRDDRPITVGDFQRLLQQHVGMATPVSRYPALDARTNPILAERVRDQPLTSLAAAAHNAFGSIGESVERASRLLGEGPLVDAVKQHLKEAVKTVEEQRGVLSYACTANPRTAAFLSLANSDWMRDHAADIKRAEKLANAVDAASGNAGRRWQGGAGGHAQGGARVETRTCHYCKQPGHIEASCRRKAYDLSGNGAGSSGAGGTGTGPARGGGRGSSGGASGGAN